MIFIKLIPMTLAVLFLVYLEDRYKSRPRTKERTLAYILTVIVVLTGLFIILIAINNIFPCSYQ